MARKTKRVGKVTGYSTARSSRAHSLDTVVLRAEITDPSDPGRPVDLLMTPAEARRWAEGLVTMADALDARQSQHDDRQPVDFVEDRPGVWKTATPEDAARLDASIDDALANLDTSLAELRDQEHRHQGKSWRDFLATLPEAQRQCTEDPGHCEHLEHLTCCLCGFVTKECADPECDSTAYLGSDFCAVHA